MSKQNKNKQNTTQQNLLLCVMITGFDIMKETTNTISGVFVYVFSFLSFSSKSEAQADRFEEKNYWKD